MKKINSLLVLGVLFASCTFMSCKKDINVDPASLSETTADLGSTARMAADELQSSCSNVYEVLTQEIQGTTLVEAVGGVNKTQYAVSSILMQRCAGLSDTAKTKWTEVAKSTPMKACTGWINVYLTDVTLIPAGTICRVKAKLVNNGTTYLSLPSMLTMPSLRLSSGATSDLATLIANAKEKAAKKFGISADDIQVVYYDSRNGNSGQHPVWKPVN